MVLVVEPLSEAEDIHDVDKFKEDFVTTTIDLNAQQDKAL
jgi:virulence-associated protein VagC